jgi:hypothetical protein
LLGDERLLDIGDQVMQLGQGEFGQVDVHEGPCGLGVGKTAGWRYSNRLQS